MSPVVSNLFCFKFITALNKDPRITKITTLMHRRQKYKRSLLSNTPDIRPEKILRERKTDSILASRCELVTLV